MNGGFLLAAGGASIGMAVGAKKAYNVVKIKRAQRVETKTVGLIKGLDKEKFAQMSTRARAKKIRRYVKANMTSCKQIGGTIFGYLPSATRIGDKATEALNMIDQYQILQSLETKAKKKAKLEKRIQTKKNLLASLSLKSKPGKWTEELPLPDGGVIYDRRNEIDCFTLETKQAFQQMVEGQPKTAKGNGCMVVARAGQDVAESRTYARSSDKSKADSLAKLLLQDILAQSKKLSPEEASALLPVEIVTIVLEDDKYVTRKSETPKSFTSFAQIEAELGVDSEVTK